MGRRRGDQKFAIKKQMFCIVLTLFQMFKIFVAKIKKNLKPAKWKGISSY